MGLTDKPLRPRRPWCAHPGRTCGRDQDEFGVNGQDEIDGSIYGTQLLHDVMDLRDRRKALGIFEASFVLRGHIWIEALFQSKSTLITLVVQGTNPSHPRSGISRPFLALADGFEAGAD
jgi:hypothetical protein